MPNSDKNKTNIEWLAENAWLKAVERIAIPVLIALMWQVWTDIGSLKQAQPVMELRVSNMESQQKEATVRAGNALADRAKFQSDVLVQITNLQGQITTLQQTSTDLKSAVKELTTAINKAAQ